jgi:hypothetical protein
MYSLLVFTLRESNRPKLSLPFNILYPAFTLKTQMDMTSSIEGAIMMAECHGVGIPDARRHGHEGDVTVTGPSQQ